VRRGREGVYAAAVALSSLTARSGSRRLPVLLAAAALASGLAACGSDDGGDDASTSTAASAATQTAPASTTAPAATTAEAAAAPACKSVDAPDPRTDEPDLPKPRPSRISGRWTVTMRTNCGDFTIRLDTKRQPKTSASFKSLVTGKFYDGLTFHRIAEGFVIQGGDPQGTGTGGPGYSVRETPPNDAAYTRGVVAMAKTGSEPAGTSGSQFFVVTGEDAGLNPDYAIVGRITKGMDTIDAISAVGSTGPPNDEAAEPVVIQRATAARG
jgi:cyclophilin family peptidyl-prolyl cis-trans isomerase